MLQQVKCSCTSSSFSSRSLLGDMAQIGAGKRKNMASPHPYGCWWVHRDTQPVPRSSDWRSRKQSSPTTTAVFPWLQGLNATFAYWQITQEKIFLEENQQTWVSALAQILLLQKPGAGATLAFAVTWLKTQTTGEPRHGRFRTPRRCRAGTCRGCCGDRSGYKICPWLCHCRRSTGFLTQQG